MTRGRPDDSTTENCALGRTVWSLMMGTVMYCMEGEEGENCKASPAMGV